MIGRYARDCLDEIRGVVVDPDVCWDYASAFQGQALDDDEDEDDEDDENDENDEDDEDDEDDENHPRTRPLCEFTGNDARGHAWCTHYPPRPGVRSTCPRRRRGTTATRCGFPCSQSPATQHPEARPELLELTRRGRLDALTALGDVRQIPVSWSRYSGRAA